MIRWFVVFACFMASGIGAAQNPILWTQASTGFSSSRILLDTSGNVYWVGVREQGNSAVLYATKYSASGLFQGQAVFGVNDAQAPSIVEPSLVGNRLYIGFRAIDSYLAAIDVTTMATAWTKTLTDVELWGIHGTATQVVTVEEQSSTLNYVRRRSGVNGNVVTPTALASIGGIQRSAMDGSGHVYVIGSGATESTSRIMRVNSGGSIHYDNAVTFVGYNTRRASAIQIDIPNQTLWVGYYAVVSGQSTSNALLRRFNLADGTGATWTFDVSVDDVISSICPMGDGSVSLAMNHWDLSTTYGCYLARRNSSGTMWSRNFTNTVFSPGYMALDATGNLAVIREDISDPFFNTMIVEKLNASTGNAMWRHTLTGSPSQVLTTASGAPVFLSGDGRLHMTQGLIASFSRSSVIGGSNVDLNVTLTRPTLAGNQQLQLLSNAAELPVPATVDMVVATTNVVVPIVTQGVSATKTASVNIRHAGFILQRQVTLLPPVLSTVTVSPNKATGGTSMAGTVAIAGKAPAGGWSVDLTSSNTTAATVPATVAIAEGATSAGFQVSTSPVGANAGVVVTATKGGVSRTAFIAVNAPTLSTFTLGSSSVQGGTNGSLTVTLNGNAPTAGFSISLLSGASTLAVLPSSTSVPSGTNTRTLSFATSAVTSSIGVTLVAYRGSIVRTQTLTLTP